MKSISRQHRMPRRLTLLTTLRGFCLRALALSLPALAPQAPSAAPLFTAQFLAFDTGARPQSVAIGDVNGDDRPDLAVANVGSSTVSVLLGNGDGSFGPKTDYATGSTPLSVAIGELNGDKQPDLAVANGLNTVSVLIGNSDGTFQPKTDFASGPSPFSVAIGDLNGDGRGDLAVVSADANAVSVLLGNGDGTFRPKTDFGTGTTPFAVAIGDLNGDGRPDLAVANEGSNTVSVLLGNGNGTFRPKTDFGVGVFPASVAIGDLNGDKRPDLAVANADSMVDAGSTVSVLLGNGDGTFGPKTDFAVGSRPLSVAIGDLNGDCRQDLAVANAGPFGAPSSVVSVLLGNGNGTFRPKTDFRTGRLPFSVAIEDLSGDGQKDLAVANLGSNTVSVLLGNGDGTFGAKTEFGAGRVPLSVATGDLNADGRLDLAVANAGSFVDPGNTVSVFLGNGNGTFGPKTDFGTGLSPLAVAIGDLNGDGRPDLAVANSGSASDPVSTVSVLLGNGNGTFRARADFGAGRSPHSLAIGDLNRDGRPDLVVANAGSLSDADSTVSVLLGNGDGTFRPKTDFVAGSHPFSVVIGEVNGDGRPDLAVAIAGSASEPDSTVAVLLGNGDGTFRASTRFRTGIGPTSVALADLTGDGRQDLAVANLFSSTVSVLLGNGDGSFGRQTQFRIGLGTISVVIGDLNGDRRPDLALACEGTNAITVLLGNGTGGILSKANFGAGNVPNFVALGDFNGDSRPDMAVSNFNSTVSVLLNRGTNQVATEVSDLMAAAADGRVQIRWRLSSEARLELQGIAIQRARAAVGPYAVINADLLQPALDMAFEDIGIESGSYWYRLVLVSRAGTQTFAGPVDVQVGAGAPRVTALYQPFEPAGGAPIQIRYSLAGDRIPVRLAIYDVRGHLVWSSERRVREPGEHTQTWDRRDVSGTLVSRGMYFVGLDAGGVIDSKKLLLVHR